MIIVPDWDNAYLRGCSLDKRFIHCIRISMMVGKDYISLAYELTYELLDITPRAFRLRAGSLDVTSIVIIKIAV